ncbi:unnamed protein product [Blepharisma stoltei]|uniref:Leucine-rich repeat-containing protein n=1 Tax=Blepharisma stoltei TaxID=1481888 RepID=A0AAU9JTA0_9CILI|nr:unnamed protein product [Blepharisma stoltei]
MNSHSELKFNPQGVMGRMEWFRDLRRIFNKFGIQENKNSENDIDSIQKIQLLEELNNRAHKFELQSPSDIDANNSTTYFSFEEVLNCLKSSDSKILTWDKVIDLLISLSVTLKSKKTQRKPDKSYYRNPSIDIENPQQIEVTPYTIDELSSILDQANAPPKPYHGCLSLKDLRTPIKSFRETPDDRINNTLSRCSSSIKLLCSEIENYEKINSGNSYDLSFPGNKSSIVPEAKLRKYGNSLLYLSLAGNLLTHTKWEFPESLIILNLASNEIQEFSMSKSLPSLKLLNLSNNRIRTIGTLPRIKEIIELYAGYNCLTSVSTLCKLEKLKILDIQHNSISNFEDIAILSINPKLTTMNIKGNPIESRLNFQESIKITLPKVYNLNPTSIFEFSEFKDFGYMPFIPLKKPPEHSKPYRPIGPDSSIKENFSIETPRPLTPVKPQSVSYSLNSSKIQESFISLSERTKIAAAPQASFRSTKHDEEEFETPINFSEIPFQIPTPRSEEFPSRQRSQSVTKISMANSMSQMPANKYLVSQGHNTEINSAQHNKSDVESSYNSMPQAKTLSKLFESSRNKNKEDAYEEMMSFMSQAENRIKKEPEIKENFIESAINAASAPILKFKNEYGIRPVKVNYGNPEAALMIGPPAIKPQVKQKQSESAYDRTQYEGIRAKGNSMM